MKLSDVARAFDKTPCLDGYSGFRLFMGQLQVYDGNVRDSETAERRVLSVGPQVEIPARRVIAVDGLRYIVGRGTPDGYRGGVIRVGYVVQVAPSLAHVQTLAQLCTDTPGLRAYSNRVWIKEKAYTEHDSVLTQQNNFYFSEGEPVSEQQIITFEGIHNVARSVNNGASGVLNVLCDQMKGPVVETGTIKNGGYDAISDTVGGAPSAVRVVRVHWQSLFAYKNHLAPKFGPGDIQVVIAASVLTPKPGAELSLSDGTWKLQSCLLEGDVYLCRAVRNGP